MTNGFIAWLKGYISDDLFTSWMKLRRESDKKIDTDLEEISKSHGLDESEKERIKDSIDYVISKVLSS